MTYPKLLKLCALAFLLLASMAGHSQCPVEIKTKHKSEAGKGIIELVVKSNEPYVIELLSSRGIEKTVVQTKTGSGNEKFNFKDLALSSSYQLSVSFPASKDFLCRKRYSEEIFFDIN